MPREKTMKVVVFQIYHNGNEMEAAAKAKEAPGTSDPGSGADQRRMAFQGLSL